MSFEKTSRISIYHGMVGFNGTIDRMRYTLGQAIALLPRELQTRFQDEIEILPHYIFYRVGIYRNMPGWDFQNWKFSGNELTKSPMSKIQKNGYFLLGILLPYLFKKLKRRALKRAKEGSRGQYILLGYLEKLYKFGEALNTIKVVRGSVYANLLHRVLRIRYQVVDMKSRRYVDYHFMNRVIVWQELSNFMAFLVPFSSSDPVAELFKKVWLFTTKLGPLLMDLKPPVVEEADKEVEGVEEGGDGSEVKEEGAKGQLEKGGALKSSKRKEMMACAVCGANPPTLPRRLECGHVFCHACLVLEGDSHVMGEDDSCSDGETSGGICCPKCHKTSEKVLGGGLGLLGSC